MAGETPVFQSIIDRMAEHAAACPEQEAVWFEGTSLTWAEYDADLNRVANALGGLGIGKGDKVAMLAMPCIPYIESFFGTLRAGACCVPLSSMATAEQLELMVEDSDAKVLMVDAKMRPLVEEFASRLKNIVPGGLIAYDFEAEVWQDFAAWRDAASPEHPGIEILPEDDFNIIYSSGTTGTPKGILHNHQLRAAVLDRMAGYGYGPDAKLLVSTPLYSNTTLAALLPASGLGSTVVLMPKNDTKRFLQLAEQHRITHAMLVPVQYDRLLADEDFDRTDLSSFHMKFSTSAPLREGTKRGILERWPGGLVEIYGLTEGGATCILEAHEHPDKLHTVGPPAPNCEVRIIDPETLKELPKGEVGELVGRAPFMMTGYYKLPEKTREIHWRSPEGELFFRSGDTGRFDEDGFVVLLDRIKDVIVSGGFNVYAADLENALLKHPDVADVAVIGIPSREWGETPLGLVVRKPGSEITEQALLDWVNPKLGKGQRLSGIEFREDLPRSTIGKVLKRELRAPYMQGNAAQ